MSLISSPSSLHIMCPYYLSLAPLIYSAMSTTLHVLVISSSHNVADQLFFISSYYVSILSQPSSPHILCNACHSTVHLISSSHNVADQLSFISSYYVSIPSQPCSPHLLCMSITLHIRLISSSHDVADQLSFISSYYVSILSQPCSLHLLYNVYHSSRLHMFV